MPNIGFNAHESMSKIRYELSGTRKNKSSVQHTDPFLLRALNWAYEKITEEADIAEKQGPAINMTAGDHNYPFPADLQGYKVIRIEVDPSTSTGKRKKLTRRTKQYMQDHYNLRNTNASQRATPQDWSEDPENARQFIIRPVPKETISGAIHVHYAYRPSPLRRTWRPDKASTVITASVAFGTDAVTLSAAADTAQFLVGDQFGVIPSVNFDQTAISDENPVVWYPVESIATTAVVLTEDFAEVTNAAQNFITSQVPDIESDFPGKLGWAAVWLAAAELIERDDEKRAGTLRNKAMAEIAKFQDDDDYVEVAGNRAAVHTNMFERS